MSTPSTFKIPEASLWEKRMLAKDGKVKEIAHYFPVIGRGCIAHDTISHAIVEKELRHAFSRTFMEWVRHLLDW